MNKSLITKNTKFNKANFMAISKILTDVRHFQIFTLGIFSGMPLAILFVTLSVWLKDSNIGLEVITTFAIARVFYSFKVFWAPIIDHVKIPLLSKIGMRKSWMMLCAILTSAVLYSYSLIDPNESIMVVYYITIALGFASATFDIAFDAFRIEKLDDDTQAIGAANTVFGYRIGMLIAGAGALWCADNYGWSNTFMILSGVYLSCVLFLVVVSETKIQREEVTDFGLHSWKVMAWDPLIDFFKRKYSIIILLAIILYKLGDAFLGVVANPFYMELGFSKTEVAAITKGYGLMATIIGSYLGGYLLFAIGNIRGLIIAGIAQSVTNVSFIWLNHQGYDVNALMIAITIENVAAGMGSAALVGYLSYLCNKQYSATQYALLSSASSLFSNTIVIYGGKIQAAIGWDWYFAMTVVIALPGLMLLYFLEKRRLKDLSS